MLKRTLTSVAIIAVGLVLLILSDFIVLSLALSILAVMALYEVFKVIKSHNKLFVSAPAFVIAAVFPTAVFFVDEGRVAYLLLILAAVLFVYLLYLMGVGVFSKGSVRFSELSEVFVTTVYVTMSFTSLSLLRYFDRETGVFAFVLPFLIAWICDVFAFAVGSLFGKHKLIPEVSPKKTVEGAIGGVIFAALFCVLYGFLMDSVFCGMTLNILGVELVLVNVDVNYIAITLMGIILPVVSQLGDLVASLIKREYGVKDYGKIFPGHGGIMDRFDSILSVSGATMVIVLLFAPFT